METLQTILINYIPMITVLLGFLAGCFGFLKKFASLFKNSNIEEIKQQIQDNNSDITAEMNKLIDLAKQVMTENQQLKVYNRELLSELKRISDYEPEELKED